MFWTLLALLLLVVLGGFISYYGDLQGRRWGKKRVSWFGLRPKHTAILITSLTGAVIALLSVGAVILAAPNVREVVLRGEAAINENKRLKTQYQREIESMSVRLKEISRTESTSQAVLNDTLKQLARAKSDNDQAQQKNGNLEKDNRGLVDVNMNLQRQRYSLLHSIQQAQVQLAVVQKQNANAEFINKQISRQNTDLSRQNAGLERENSGLVKANGALKETNQQLLADNTDLKKKNEDLTKIKTQLEGAYSGLLNENQAKQEEFQKNKEQSEAAIARLRDELSDLTEQRAQLYKELAGTNRNFVQTYLELRQTRYNLRADTELARRTLDAHLSPSAVKEELIALLKDASDRAKAYGASAGANGRTVCIVPKRVVTPASVQVADENASLNAIVEAIAGSNTPVVVVARAINNSVAQEQVLIELSSYTSATVFKQGEVIARRPIDAHQPMDRLVTSVVNFLKEDVRNAAIRAGTIPQISPETGEEEVGILDTPELVSLVDRIRRMGGQVVLQAVANAPLTSADLLTFGQNRGGKASNLRFELRRPSDKAVTRSAGDRS